MSVRDFERFITSTKDGDIGVSRSSTIRCAIGAYVDEVFFPHVESQTMIIPHILPTPPLLHKYEWKY